MTTIQDIKVFCTAPQGINLVVVRVETNQPGLYGLGCATFAYRHLTVQHLIETYFKPLLVGRPVNNISELWQLMHQNAYWRNGPIANNAISGIDMALWDIKGKMANMPCYELFGGKMREGVRIYRHVNGRDAAEVEDQIRALMETGVRHFRCGASKKSHGSDVYGAAPDYAVKGGHDGIYFDSREHVRELIEFFGEMRARMGFEPELMTDVHERIHPTDARVLAHELDPFRLFFIEDIIGPEYMDYFPDIRAHCVTPLSMGELFVNNAEFRSVITQRCIDFVRVHPSFLGGVTPCLRLMNFANEFGVRVCWHGPGDMNTIGHTVNVHLDLAAPNFAVQEWNGTAAANVGITGTHERPEAILEVFDGMPVFDQGFLYANDRPGWGIEFDEVAAAKYPCKLDVTTWTQMRSLDGSLLTP